MSLIISWSLSILHNLMKKLVYLLAVLSMGVCVAGAGMLYWLVVLQPGQEIKPENIHRILGKESPVFYSDGETRLGVFFDEAHRQYVPFNRIPKDFVNALVASEDEKFFSHFGFDPLGITRAAIKNLLAGRVVQGGSTLTQQTAKNLFKRTERSLSAKLKELLFALRLEHSYSKEKIFEFYANQFFVSGNALGLGVAARYYFNKLPEDLTLLECAFIAGSVKRPNYYNPFIQKTEEGAEIARKRARDRVGYVLGKMLDLGMIQQAQYEKVKGQDIVFDKGKVGYSLDYVMEMVREAVSTSEVLDALASHDITNLATSGVRIITTVDKAVQGKTLSALRHELSQLDVRLRGYERDEVQAELKKVDYDGDETVQEGAFLPGTITKISSSGDNPIIEVVFDGRLGGGIVDRDGLKNIAEARAKWQRQAGGEASKKDYAALLGQMKEHDRIWVSIRALEPEGKILLDLEKYPEVEGGGLVMQDGRIKAVAGGVENRFFNRAIYAKRTMGSSFKPFVFTAALELGWNTADPLSNVRDVFVFQNQAYFPRPDHISPHENVSMSWAGVESENLAAVWLTYHLCDKLNESQFKDVATHLGLAPRVTANGEEETYNAYKARIRDSYGIIIDEKALHQAAFFSALANSETDFIFENRLVDYKQLKKLHYGQGFEGFKSQIESGRGAADADRQELYLRGKILSNSFLSLQNLKKELDSYKREVEGGGSVTESEGGQPDDFSGYDSGQQSGILCYDKYQERYSYERRNEISPNMVPVNKFNLRDLLQSQEESERKNFWKNVSIKSTVSLAAFDMLESQMNIELARLQKLPPYSLEVLSSVRDFRVRVGLEYLIELAHRLGVKSKLEPVLSFPLGSNVVTLLEATRMYEGIVTGSVSIYGEQSEDNGDLLTIIDHIEAANGEILYRPKKTTTHPVSPEISLAVGHILENVIKYGTGKFADKNVRMIGKGGKTLNMQVPLLGKTGTANSYTNASFFGYLPGLGDQASSMVIDGGFAVGTYVGFDDNKVMRHGATRVTGAVGALPTWTDIVNTLLWKQSYGLRLNVAELPSKSLAIKRNNLGQINAAVQTNNGGLLAKSGSIVDEYDRRTPSVMTFGTFDESGEFETARFFKPCWKEPQQQNN
jgi:penicillin-binding protein 1A